MQSIFRPAAIVGLAAASLINAGSARAAGSAVYIKAGNVFIADADGQHEHQVTADGSTADAKLAYRSPSEADDGTVVALKGAEIWHLNQNGTVISHAIPATKAYPLTAEVSPDGMRVAYNYSLLTQCVTWNAYSCGFYPSPGTAMQSLTTGASTDISGPRFTEDPHWVGNGSIVLQTDSSYVDVYDVASDTTVDWFVPEDLGIYPMSPIVSRSGRLFALVSRPTKSGGNPTADDVLEIWKTNGAPTKNGHEPTFLCAFNAPNASGFNNVRFTPDDSAVTWDDAAGVQHEAVDGDCSGGQVYDPTLDTALVPGATQLSFGVAANAPAAPPAASAPAGAASGGGAGAPAPAPPAAPAPISLSPLGTLRRSKLVSKGLKAIVLCAAACKFTATIEADHKTAKALGLKGKGTVSLGSAKGSSSPGGAEITVKLTKTAKTALARRLHKGKKVTLTIDVKTRQDGGSHQFATTALTVKG